MKKIRVGDGRECNECANETSGLQGGVKIMELEERQGSVLTNQCLGRKEC